MSTVALLCATISHCTLLDLPLSQLVLMVITRRYTMAIVQCVEIAA